MPGLLAWLQAQGCTVEITQPDDGSGYYCADVTTPDGTVHHITETSD